MKVSPKQFYVSLALKTKTKDIDWFLSDSWIDMIGYGSLFIKTTLGNIIISFTLPVFRQSSE